MLQREAADCGYECGEFCKTAAVERIGALLFAQADREQLHQPGLDGPVKVGMRLDAIDGNSDVCFTVGCLIEPDRHAAFNVAEQDGVHVGADWAAHGLFGYAVMGEYLKLALCRSAAVAAHGGHDEGLCAKLLDLVRRRLQHQIDAVDAAAAAGKRHTLSRLYGLANLRSSELTGNGSGHVIDSGSNEISAVPVPNAGVFPARISLEPWFKSPLHYAAAHRPAANPFAPCC